ncbi:MAG: phosphate ABC transporter substrate-binding protein PstS [Leptolyngbyaceae cyanobacterium SL_5_9]|nr:phosphate ABC transporter substrate-binding protein PstS [Leptolyngbyaceae cyanobacterium SL_5_9]
MWFEQYTANTSNVEIYYEAVGSGSGIQQFLAQEVNFANTDVPLTDEEIAQFPSERCSVLQIPITGSAIVFAYNLEGINQLQLSREAYCGIVTGEITHWNDPILIANNPNVGLPNLPITFVHRSDNSGTTFIFTTHLAQACSNWTAKVGRTIDWVVGDAVPGNLGVTAKIKQTEGAIGYIGFAYAEQGFLPMASLKNKAGFFIKPSPNAAERAIDDFPKTDALVGSFPDPDEVDAYPIIGLTYLLLYENYPDQATKAALQDLVQWMLQEEGRAIADAMGYTPLSRELTDQVIARVDGLESSSKGYR